MTDFELIVRTVGGTATLILAGAIARTGHAGAHSRVFGAALCLGVIVYLACSGASPACESPWFTPAIALASAIPFFFWGWTASVMDDEFAVPPLAIIGAVVLVSATFAGAHAGAEIRAIAVVLHSLLGLAFIVAALISVLRGWRQDLVEQRRSLRVLVAVLGGLYSMAILIVELFLRARPAHEALLLVNALLLGLLLLGIACAVLGVSPQASAAFGWAAPAPPAAVEPAENAVRDREQELVNRLNQLMSREAAYRDAALSIPLLATRLGVPEKKLRQTINGKLGFRNFPGFVNAFRVEEVRRRLHEPGQDDVPILTMALEAGFGSIVAFNRAFKDRYGVTPSAYRSHRSTPGSRGRGDEGGETRSG